MSESAWIFLSHSHLDVDGVYQVRDMLEGWGHRPLMFFLKCLTDESEVEGLIAREIAARDWFVLCDSENARKAEWVQRERQIIASYPDKINVSIDLDRGVRSQLDILKNLSKRATIFLSCAHLDEQVAGVIKSIFRAHDYRVLTGDDIAPGEGIASDIGASIEGLIDRAVAEGYVLVLLTENSIRSEWVAMEVRYALACLAEKKRGYNVIPIMLEPFQDQPNDLRRMLTEKPVVMRPEHLAEDTEALIRDLKHRDMK